MRSLLSSEGKECISSRCISTRFRTLSLVSLINACTDLTKLDLPVPRAPHKRALLAGSPTENLLVFSNKMSACLFIPLSKSSGSLLTCGTGSSQPPESLLLACHTNASADDKSPELF